jgi:4-hydroxybutyrate dehydrogenase
MGIAGGFDGFCDFIAGLNAALGIPKNLTELGVTDPDLDRLSGMAITDPSAGGNPIALNLENTKALIALCL